MELDGECGWGGVVCVFVSYDGDGLFCCFNVGASGEAFAVVVWGWEGRVWDW